VAVVTGFAIAVGKGRSIGASGEPQDKAPRQNKTRHC